MLSEQEIMFIDGSFEIKMMFKIINAYHVEITYHKMDGVAHSLARGEEQCCEGLSENYAK